jgi:hypothetical protein
MSLRAFKNKKKKKKNYYLRYSEMAQPRQASYQRRSLPVVTLGSLALHSAWGANPGFDWASPAVSL